MFWGRSLALVIALIVGAPAAWAQVGCVPNPNLAGPPHLVDGCPLPASALNNLVTVNSPCANILNYGGIRNNTGDNVPAWNAAKAASSCIYLPTGAYRFAGPISYTTDITHPTFTIKGDAPEATVLTWPNSVTTALQIRLGAQEQTFHVRDLTMTTGTIASDTAVDVAFNTFTIPPLQSSFAPNDFTNVVFRSDEGYWNQNLATPIRHSWRKSINVSDVSVIDFVGVKIWGPTPDGVDGWPSATGGDGIAIQGTHSGSSANVFNFAQADFNFLNNGLIIGTLTQGYQISLSNFTGNRVGVLTGAVQNALAQLSITTSQFNNLHSIILNSRFPAVQVANSTFFVNGSGTAINMSEEQIGTIITGNIFLGALPSPSQIGDAVVLHPANPYTDVDSTPPLIVGNNFYRLFSGITLGANMGPALIHSNIFHKTATNIVNLSSNKEVSITGATRLGLPLYGSIVGAADNGSGFIRVTLSAPTDLVTGMMVMVGSLNGITGLGPNDPPLVTMVQVIDSTHVDLTNILFSGSYVSGGRLTTMP